MDGRLRADFHTHTGFSDGRGSMGQLVEAARERRLDAIAITDHDVLGGARWAYGWARHQDRLAAAGEAPGITIIAGVEISSFITRRGKPDIIHMQLLGVDPFDSGLVALCEDLRRRRIEQLHHRLEHVRSIGFELDPEATARILEKAFWGKQEIARELVLKGDFEGVDAAYHAIWDCYDPSDDIDAYVPAHLAIETGHACGAISLIAHPLRDETTRRLIPLDDVEERLDLLQDMGLDGAECFYSAFLISDCLALEGIARTRGLVVSCGSDHHDYARRNRLSITCSDGLNYGHRTNVLEALGINIRG
ncbi:MAG: PHP domain-containing protein [Atopobiaceae bacterium]|nr:PHP domain-containing protein [Atopobiaceae bacterium]